MDNITLQRIATLHPKIRQKVLDAYIYINNKLWEEGHHIEFSTIIDGCKKNGVDISDLE